MFRPKFQLILTIENFYPSTVICLGSQMISLINFLETKLPPHTWYGADINAIGQTSKQQKLPSGVIKKIGSDSSLIKTCSEIDQFLSGVFFAIQNGQQYEPIDIEVDTEDKPFRVLNIDGVLLEIRAFDTSFFEIFSENEKVLKELSENFNSHVKQDSKYKWNDYVLIASHSPALFHPGQVGVICGMSKIKFEEVAKKYHAKMGDWIYTVDLGNGGYVQVLEIYLEKYPNNSRV